MEVGKDNMFAVLGVRWYGHGKDYKMILQGSRLTWRPKTIWEDQISRDIKNLGIIKWNEK